MILNQLSVKTWTWNEQLTVEVGVDQSSKVSLVWVTKWEENIINLERHSKIQW